MRNSCLFGLISGCIMPIVIIVAVICIVVVTFPKAGHLTTEFYDDPYDPPTEFGLTDRTLWDFLEIIIVPAIAAYVVGNFTLFINYWQQQNTKALAEREEKAQEALAESEAKAQRQDQLERRLQDYISEMQALILDRNLKGSKTPKLLIYERKTGVSQVSNAVIDDNVRQIARTRTFSTIKSLDVSRNLILFTFLQEAGLLKPQQDTGEPIVDLSHINLRGIDLTRVNLSETKLVDANLTSANMQGADLRNTSLIDTSLRHANLSNAILTDAYLVGTFLNYSNLENADLSYVRTDWFYQENPPRGNDKVTMVTGHSTSVHFLGANLSNAFLFGADLSDSVLTKANLTRAYLKQVNLEGTNLTEANLTGADLTEANLAGANLTKAKFTEKTTLPDGTKWTPGADERRFTDPNHHNFWRSDKEYSPAYRRDDESKKPSQ